MAITNGSCILKGLCNGMGLANWAKALAMFYQLPRA